MDKYFNEQNKYKEPVLIKFDEPKTLKLCELKELLDSYKPFSCANVWAYGEFEYGDYDNWVQVIYEDISIDATYSHVYREATGIYQENQTAFEVVSHFWYYKKDFPFWKYCPEIGYHDLHTGLNYIDEVEITINGVYIISWNDKNQLEKTVN